MCRQTVARYISTLAILAALLLLPQPGAMAQAIVPEGPGGCWSVLPTPPITASRSTIGSISASSPTDVWALGSFYVEDDVSGGPFVMRFDGSSWDVAGMDVMTQPITLSRIDALAPDDVWAVGSYDAAQPAGGSPNNQRLILHWDGLQWTVSYRGGPGRFNGVSALAADNVWAVGDMGRGTSQSGSYVYHWDGSRWTERQLITPYLNSIIAFAPNDVWAVGADTFHWDGQFWLKEAAHEQEKSGLLAVSSSEIWSFGGSSLAPDQAATFRWNNESWDEVRATVDVNTTINGIAAYSASDMWAVGKYDAGALLLHWNGLAWSGIPNPVPALTSELNDIEKVGEEMWAAGSRTTNSVGGEALIMRYSKAPCSAPAPPTPLNPPVPLPGTNTLPFVGGKSISGVFLDYWQANGGLAQHGYPITEVMGEISEVDGKLYTTQYFERSQFEYHPEYAGTEYEVLLAHLGALEYRQRYPNGAPNQRPNRDDGTLYFPETGKSLGGAFRVYWQENGGLQQQGYPISDEFTEISKLNGLPYTVQYFERAVFEWHPELDPPYNVLLSQLGTARRKRIYEPPSQPPALSQHRRVAANVMDGWLEGGGTYAVWNEQGSGTRVTSRGYDAEQNAIFLVSNRGGGSKSADSRRAMWADGGLNRYGITDLTTRIVFTLSVPADTSSGTAQVAQFALDDNSLYYVRTEPMTTTSRIVVQNTVSREDRVVATTGNRVEGLWAANGSAMWVEQSGGSPERSLHVWSEQARSEFVPARGIGAFSGFGALGDYVMWSFYTTIQEQVTYLFNLRTGERLTLNTGRASGSVIGENRVAWTRWPGDAGAERGGWSIEVYNMETGEVDVAVSDLPAMPRDILILEGNKLAFTADLDLGSPAYELYLTDLD